MKIQASHEKYSPFNKNGAGNQGYLFPLSNELAKLLLSEIKKNNGNIQLSL